jgi:hypothetical protein
MDNMALVRALQDSGDPFFRALGTLAALREQRGQQYNQGGIKLEDYFPFGRHSYAHMCWLKAMRMRSTLNNAGTEYNLDFADSAMDLANYSIFTLMAELERPKT